MPSSDKLELILHDLLLRIFPPGDWDVNVDEIAQARQQIIDWALEIVGEDETEGRDCDYEGGDPAFDRNELRRELRRKLKGGQNWRLT